MTAKHKYPIQELDQWRAGTNTLGNLIFGGCNTVELAHQYGTPAHVVDCAQLSDNASNSLGTLREIYPGKATAHFAFKCNSVPGVIGVLRDAGLKAEVMSVFELQLAMEMGYCGQDIIVNGPYKPDAFLEFCLHSQVRLIVVDSISELLRLEKICANLNCDCAILLRVNIDYIPKGMNSGSATASRKGSFLGLDLRGGEVHEALRLLQNFGNVHFKGYHFHIGTGISDPKDYYRALHSLSDIIRHTINLGFRIEIFDTGGGIATSFSREMTSWQMMLYQILGLHPGRAGHFRQVRFEDFIEAITEGMQYLFGDDLPELIMEPGRCITSGSQLLLLTIHDIKCRPGVKTWLITDGGIGTVSMPTYYEWHKVLLCNDVRRVRVQKVTISGPGCFAADIVYRNIRMPEVKPGETLAVMDSGAYFTSWESSFGHPRPPVIAAENGIHYLLRRRESFKDMIQRDCTNGQIFSDGRSYQYISSLNQIQ